jgi:hypothetical protein
LRVKDRIRLTLFSRRFAPAACITLESGSVLTLEDERIVRAAGVRQIAASGRLRRVRPT